MTDDNANYLNYFRMSYLNLQRRWGALLSRCDERSRELERLRADWTSFNADYEALQAWVREQSLVLKGMDVQARVNTQSISFEIRGHSQMTFSVLWNPLSYVTHSCYERPIMSASIFRSCHFGTISRTQLPSKERSDDRKTNPFWSGDPSSFS